MNKETHPFRKKLRLNGFDYSSPAYYHIVIVTDKRINYLGEIISEQMNLSPFGEVLSDVLDNINDLFPNIEVVKYQIMPNHIHLLVNLVEINSAGKLVSIPDFVSRIKTFSVWKYKNNQSTTVHPVLPYKVWQRSYYDHILRTNNEAEITFDYIDFNPDQNN